MKKLHFALIFSSFLTISGCSDKTSDEYISLAETNIQENDIPSAVLALKNAININGQDPRSRFILGRLYAQRGSSAAAEKELARALELGYEPNEVLPILAKSYSLQFKHEEIIKLVEDSRGLAPEVSTSLLLYKALAHFQLGKPYKARKAVSDANEISSESLYSKLGNAYVDFSNKQVDTSLEKINEILKEQPDFADAHLLKGQLTSASDDAKGAVKSFEKYRELLPETFQARVLLANAYIKNKQFEEAEKELDILLKVSPDQPFVNQLKGTVRFEAEDFTNAKFFSEKAIQGGRVSVSNRVIAGVSAFRLQNFEQAFEHIDLVKDQLAKDSPIQKLLTVLQLNLGFDAEAEQTLLDIGGLNENDIVLLSAASTQLFKNGNIEKAKQVAELANSLEFTNASNLTQKGMLRLSLDELEGISDLEKALQIDPELNSGNTALARAYIENGFYDKAYELSKVWIEQKPDEVNGYILAAVVEINRENLIEAEKMYHMALSIDGANPAANIYFADKNEAEGNSKAAVDYLYEALKVYPSHLSALTKYFVLNKRLEQPENGLGLIKEALDKNTSNSRLLLLYVQALYSDKQYSRLIKAVDTNSLTVASDGKIWETLANAHLKLNDSAESELVLKLWRGKQPNSKKAFINSISLQELLGEYQKALNLVKDANGKFENDIQFQILTAYLYMKNGLITEAKSTFDSLPAEVTNTPTGNGLLGQILLANNESQGALPLLMSFYDAAPDGKNAMLVAKALKISNKIGLAFDFLTTHVQSHGNSPSIDSQLAELSILSGDYKDAERSYRTTLQSDPKNVRALNNLANILMQDSKFDEALPLAKQAAELVPENASILDTYSQLLAKTGREDLALPLAKKAYALNNSSTTLSLNFAELLIGNGKNAQAKEVLDAIKNSTSEINEKINSLKGKL